MGAEQARAAFAQIHENVQKHVPGAKIQGILIEQMAPKGVEVILGASRDARFGPLMMFGLGGTMVEVLKDVTFRLAPMWQISAERMVRSIKAFKMLDGFRGNPPCGRRCDRRYPAAAFAHGLQPSGDFRVGHQPADRPRPRARLLGGRQPRDAAQAGPVSRRRELSVAGEVRTCLPLTLNILDTSPAKCGKTRREDLKPGECLCTYCTAKCCRYFALAMDKPTTWRDFDHMRWFLLHEKASVFVEEGDWYLLVHTPCKHLQPNNLCGIYETRPNICRAYTTDKCEYDEDWVYDHYWETAEQVMEYAEAVLGPRRGESFRSPKPA